MDCLEDTNCNVCTSSGLSAFIQEDDIGLILLTASYAAFGWIAGEVSLVEAWGFPPIEVVVNGVFIEVGCVTGMYKKPAHDKYREMALRKFSKFGIVSGIEESSTLIFSNLLRNHVLGKVVRQSRGNGIFPYYSYLLAACITVFLQEHRGLEGESFSVASIVTGLFGDEGIAEHILWVDCLRMGIASKKNKRSFIEDCSRAERLKELWSLGFRNENTYHGCGQCTIMTLGEFFNLPFTDIFQAASAFSGGIGLAGDGSCGGYLGGVLVMGMFAGRRYNHLMDGDKDAQYLSFRMAQKLHDLFVHAYGGVSCRDVQTCVFGRYYCLLTKEVRMEFEVAGAHKDKCTAVIGAASVWVAEILAEEGFHRYTTSPDSNIR